MISDSYYVKSSIKRQETSECYVPSDTLVKYMEQKLRLTQIVHDKTERGEEVSKEEGDSRILLDRRKVDILNKHIFPSMANVTYFLEFINEHPILRKSFENDLKELLGVDQGPGDRSPIARDTFVFRRFINAAIARGSGFDSSNFRTLLLEAMQYDIIQEIVSLSIAVHGHEMTNIVIVPDMATVLAWVKSFSRIHLEREKEELRELRRNGTDDDIKEREQRQPHRPVRF